MSKSQTKSPCSNQVEFFQVAVGRFRAQARHECVLGRDHPAMILIEAVLTGNPKRTDAADRLA
jgi:hypothetical protein